MGTDDTPPRRHAHNADNVTTLPTEGSPTDALQNLSSSSVHAAIGEAPQFNPAELPPKDIPEKAEQYITGIVDVGRELERILRPDGNWMLYIEDGEVLPLHGEQSDEGRTNPKAASGTFPLSTPGNKMFLPHRVGMALQRDGWIIRNDIVRRFSPVDNASLETHGAGSRSPHERARSPTNLVSTYGVALHLTLDTDYWYDLNSIRENHSESSLQRVSQNDGNPVSNPQSRDHIGSEETLDAADMLHLAGKNPGDVFGLPAAAATRPLWVAVVRGGCPPEVCSVCGTPRERISETIPAWERDRETVERPQLRRALEIAENAGLTEAHFEAVRNVGLGNLDGGEGKPYERVDDETERLAREAAEILGSYYREALMTEVRPTDGWEWACDCPEGGDGESDSTPGVCSGTVVAPFAESPRPPLASGSDARSPVEVAADCSRDVVVVASDRAGDDVFGG